MQGFDRLVPDARRFLAELDANNRKEWFTEHREEFEGLLRRPAEALVDRVAADLERMTRLPTRGKLFRQHRDIRFSRDKRPYKTHLHMLWSTQPPQGGTVSWFFGIEIDGLRLGAGRMSLEKDELARWREGLDGPGGEALAEEVAALTGAGARLHEPELKRVPAPYAQDHPRAGLLRHKSVSLWEDLSDPVTDLPARLQERFARFWPFQRALIALLES